MAYFTTRTYEALSSSTTKSPSPALASLSGSAYSVSSDTICVFTVRVFSALVAPAVILSAPSRLYRFAGSRVRPPKSDSSTSRVKPQFSSRAFDKATCNVFVWDSPPISIVSEAEPSRKSTACSPLFPSFLPFPVFFSSQPATSTAPPRRRAKNFDDIFMMNKCY